MRNSPCGWPSVPLTSGRAGPAPPGRGSRSASRRAGDAPKGPTAAGGEGVSPQGSSGPRRARSHLPSPSESSAEPVRPGGSRALRDQGSGYLETRGVGARNGRDSGACLFACGLRIRPPPESDSGAGEPRRDLTGPSPTAPARAPRPGSARGGLGSPGSRKEGGA